MFKKYFYTQVAVKRWPVIIIIRLLIVGEIRDRDGTRLDELGKKLGTELVENSLVPYKKYCV